MNVGSPKYEMIVIFFSHSVTLLVSKDDITLRLFLQVLLVCGLVILILGTAANIYAEEEYSEARSAATESISIPPNLKELDNRLGVVNGLPIEPALLVQSNHDSNNNVDRPGDNSLRDPLLSSNRTSSGSVRGFAILILLPVCVLSRISVTF